MRGWILGIFSLLVLGGCAGVSVWAPDEVVQQAAYRDPGPTRITMFTMISTRTGRGGHTSLMINGSQRVIWDPAGSFKHETVPERNDVLFGITPAVADVYMRYHARETWYVKVQELDVSPEVAEAALRAVQAYGPVGAAKCARTTSDILSKLPGFGQIQQTWFPVKLSEQFAQIPGVRERTLREFDSDDNTKVLLNWDPNAVARDALLLH